MYVVRLDLLLWSAPIAAQSGPPPACDSVEGFGTLDFWVGEWRVESNGQLAGTNRIEKILNGCAVAEFWTSAGGGEGQSLFYYIPALDTWRQVWVTQQATVTGGVKEKTLVERLGDGGVRFQGEIVSPDGRTYLDRTTLTPMPEGRVRQHIEISMDNGESWRTTFDAVYVPVGGSVARPGRLSGAGSRDTERCRRARLYAQQSGRVGMPREGKKRAS